MRHAFLACATVLALTTAAAPARAQQSVTIYRCTDSTGAVTVQNDRACPKGTTQDKRVLAGIPTAPPPPTLRRIVAATPQTPPTAPPASATAAASASTTAVIVAAPRAAPPRLFECRAFDGTLSLGESADATERCVPMASTGLDGNPETAAGQACEVRADTCTEITAADLCTRWQQRLRDAQTAERFGNDAGRAAAMGEIDRARLVLRESTCAAE